jgi:RNA polymerase sigma factor (sigma-70 family)
MQEHTSGRPSSGPFPATRWSLILTASRPDDMGARRALEELCKAYWKPLYAFLRRDGHTADAAADLVQGFFVRFLSKNYLAVVRPEKGRFRSYLLKALRHYVADEEERNRTEKRGGKVVHVSLDPDLAQEERMFLAEAPRDTDPQRLYERRWALTVLDKALNRLRDWYEAHGRLDHYDFLIGFLEGDLPEETYDEAATRLHVSVSAVKMSVHRFRQRFSQVLREVVADTVADASEIDDELGFLRAAIARE